MSEAIPKLGAAPIIEAVVDIDCDMPANIDMEALNSVAVTLLADKYPTARRRLLSEHVFSGDTEGALSVQSRQLQALQYLSADERQLVQFRPNGFSFNRLAPYGSLDEYLPEIQRTWSVFVETAKPVLGRAVRLRYINRIRLPLIDGEVNLSNYLKIAPRLPDEQRLKLGGFLTQQSVIEASSGNQANIVLATQAREGNALPIIFDIEAVTDMASELGDWAAISGKIQSLRLLKNLVFRDSLTQKCLSLFHS